MARRPRGEWTDDRWPGVTFPIKSNPGPKTPNPAASNPRLNAPGAVLAEVKKAFVRHGWTVGQEIDDLVTFEYEDRQFVGSSRRNANKIAGTASATLHADGQVVLRLDKWFIVPAPVGISFRRVAKDLHKRGLAHKWSGGNR